MRRRARTILAAGTLILGGAGLVPVAVAAEDAGTPGADEVKVFRAEVTKAQIPLLLAAGQDGHELGEQAPDKGTATVEVYLTDKQADQLEDKGVDLKEHTLTAKARARVAAAGDGVFRPYSGAGNLQEEILRTAQQNPALTKVVSIGKTLQGQDILALKLTKGAKKTKDGAKPSVLYMSNQHAREWITPEMTRRLMHHYLDSYSKDKRIKKIVDSTELWFVLSANPDGYDFTHRADGERQWRKNMRDVNGDGATTIGDGVDLNRNFAYKWGYDNEGSSPFPTSETYRGASPGSEPETKALDAFEKRIGFEYGINYHSAAELLLYGVGWQVASPSPDDVALQVARRYTRELRDPRLPPPALLRAVHHQRRGGRPRVQRQRHGDVHPGDVDLPDRVEPLSGRRLERGRLRLGLHLPGRREADPAGVRQEHPVRPVRRRVRGQARPAEVLGRHRRARTSPRHPSPPRTRAAPTRRSRSSYASPYATRNSSTASTAAVRRTWRSRRGRAARPSAVTTTCTSTSTAPRSPTATRATRSRSGSPARRRPGSPPRAHGSRTRSPNGRARTRSSSPRRARPPSRRRPTSTR